MIRGQHHPEGGQTCRLIKAPAVRDELTCSSIRVEDHLTISHVSLYQVGPFSFECEYE